MLRIRCSLLWGILLTLVPLAVAHAIPPPRPGILDRVTGRFLTTGERFPLFPKEMRKARPSTFGGAVPLAPARTTGGSAAPLAIGTSGNATVRPLVLLIDFADKPHTHGATQLASLFFASGPRDFSVKNYWEEASYTRQGTNIPGKTFQVLAPAAPAPQVVGWLRAGTDFPTVVTAYSQCLDPVQGANLANIRQLIADAVAYLDSAAGRAAWNVTFSQYRGPSGTAVQALVLVHPGFGAEDSGSPSLDVYSHRAELAVPVTTSDGTTIGDYITVPESQFYSDRTGGVSPPPIGAGVIVHEMGHLLGLPDLYPTGAVGQTGGGYSGVGVYDVMGYGMWGSNLQIRADNPAHPSGWSKAQLGWVVPQVQSSTAMSLLYLRPFEYYPDVHQVFPSSIDPTQWFLIENRQRLDTALAAPAWLFDNFLPGSGILIWHIDGMIADNSVIRSMNIVNNDNVYKGVDVEEANGANLLGLQFPPPPVTPNDLAPYFGQDTDYFSAPAETFSRDLPIPGANQTNSTPIVGVLPFLAGATRPPDVGDNVTITNFTTRVQPLPDGSGANYLFYDLILSGSGGGGGAAAWKTFNMASTAVYPIDNTVPVPPSPMRSDDILSLGFDSGNNVWMGSKDQGIFRFLGTRFEFLGSAEGLPGASPGSSLPLSPIRAMASEAETGSMWVGTEAGLFKMRNAGSGFRVQASFTTTSTGDRRVPSNLVQAVAVRRGIDVKYAATPAGLVRIVDRFTDSESDDAAATVLTRGDGNEGLGNTDVTAVAIDDGGTADPSDDIVWAGFSNGIVARSKVFDPVRDTDFRTFLVSGGPRINALVIDKKGILWIATDRSGVEAFDLGETLPVPAANHRDPFDFNIDGDLVGEAFLGRARGLASDNVTGIASQVTPDEQQVVWFSHGRDLNNFQGGATRFDANLANDNATVLDERLKVFRPEAGVAPENQINGPSSTWLSTAAADSAGNVWFGSTVPVAEGVSRFGNAGILSLDSSNYVNVTAIATVTLQDDGLNADRTVANRAIVFVTSAADSAGFLLELRETGPNTGIFTGQFGFSVGATSRSATPPLIGVQNGSQVTVTYYDASPRGVRTASATWKYVYPFEDALVIDGFRCFIATAAYGSALAPEVRAFRRFRDDVLMAAPGGGALVSLYYRWSPPLAAVVARSAVLRSAARFVLAPAALMAGVATGTGRAEGIAVVAVLSGLAALLWLAPRRAFRPARGRARQGAARQE